MLKIFGDSILNLFLNHELKAGNFPSIGKKLMLSQFIKNKKQLIENYCPISLLPVCGKMLEQIIYNKTFEPFFENKLISHNQSGFNPGNSCINQLLYLTHNIYQSLDNDLETRGVFLDMSKAFDKVWHEGLLFKLK